MEKWEVGGGDVVSQNWEEETLCLKIGRFVDVALSHSESLHQRVVVCLTALQSTADALGLQIPLPSSDYYSLS